MDGAPQIGKDATTPPPPPPAPAGAAATASALAIGLLVALTLVRAPVATPPTAQSLPAPPRPAPAAGASGHPLPPPLRQAPWVWRVDINAAAAPDLAVLPGIGPAMADRLVDTRTALGGFRDAESLMHTPGIGPRTLQRIRPWIVVGGSRGL